MSERLTGVIRPFSGPGVFLSAMLLAAIVNSARGADVNYFGAIKSIMYAQPAGAGPQLLSSNAFGFNTFVFATTNGVVTNASLKISSTGLTLPLLAETNDMLFRYEQWFETQSALDSAYPAGSLLKHEDYQITMRTLHDGIRTGSVSFWLFLTPLSYPATPQLANLPAGQSIDTTRDFDLQWQPVNAGALAIVQLTLLDSQSNVVFASAAPFQPGALTGSSTSVTIPSYILPAGQMLQGHLSVGNPGTPNTSSYPGATGIAALGKDTQFSLVTRPAPVPPTLSASLVSPGAIAVTVRGETNRLYQLQASGSGQTWTNLFATNASNFTFTDAVVTNGIVKLYRAMVGQ